MLIRSDSRLVGTELKNNPIKLLQRIKLQIKSNESSYKKSTDSSSIKVSVLYFNSSMTMKAQENLAPSDC